MKAKEREPVQLVEELNRELADAYQKVFRKLAEAYLNDAMANCDGSEEVISKLRQQLSTPIIHVPCSDSMGWCKPSGSSPTQMTECECLQGYVGCAWMGFVSTTLGGGWHSAAAIFGQLGQILAESYAAYARGDGACREDVKKAANERVITALGHLITEANKRAVPGLGTCTVALTNPPTHIRMTEAQCAEIPGGTWQPDRSTSCS